MNHNNMVNLFIFRRDFRIIDNKGLILSLKDKHTIPIFIFNKKQIHDNKYFSSNSFGFLIESLRDLEANIYKHGGRMYYFYNDGSCSKCKRSGCNNCGDVRILRDIIHIFREKNILIDKIFSNKDWTPFAKFRDFSIQEYFNGDSNGDSNGDGDDNIQFINVEDYTLLPMGTLLNKSGSAYKVYTPFLRNSKQFWKDIPKPQRINKYRFVNVDFRVGKNEILLEEMNKYFQNNHRRLKGGRANGLKFLARVKKQNQYSNMRDLLTYNTTQLSAYLKFGCISIREFFWTMNKYLSQDNVLFNQLIWKEFYTYICNYYPYVLDGMLSGEGRALGFGRSLTMRNKDFQERFGNMMWEKNRSKYNLFLKNWKKGNTGFPIVDAGIKELLQTGYMHNRSRLITSGFLIKLCLVDWREGELFFAQNLTDYDPAQNNGGWQFYHGGASAADYFRIISPISQGKRFDKDAKYIKKWLPQLKDIPANELLDWEKYYMNYNLREINYVKPMFNYKQRREISLETYKNSLRLQS